MGRWAAAGLIYVIYIKFELRLSVCLCVCVTFLAAKRAQ